MNSTTGPKELVVKYEYFTRLAGCLVFVMAGLVALPYLKSYVKITEMVLCMAYFTWQFFAILYRLISANEPAYVINKSGIYNKVKPWKGVFIPWKDMGKIVIAMPGIRIRSKLTNKSFVMSFIDITPPEFKAFLESSGYYKEDLLFLNRTKSMFFNKKRAVKMIKKDNYIRFMETGKLFWAVLAAILFFVLPLFLEVVLCRSCWIYLSAVYYPGVLGALFLIGVWKFFAIETKTYRRVDKLFAAWTVTLLLAAELIGVFIFWKTNDTFMVKAIILVVWCMIMTCFIFYKLSPRPKRLKTLPI
jgi:hypothetical protein